MLSNSVVPVVPQVGSFYGGGVVFSPICRRRNRLCCRRNPRFDCSSSRPGFCIRWYNGSYSTTGTASAIGTGSANTTAIISAQGGTETSYAAGLARAYTGGGYTDWFLPSKDELNKMYTNRATINTTAAANSGSDFVSDYYWSSTEIDYNYAWNQYFGSGYQSFYTKNDTYVVRAVRAF